MIKTILMFFLIYFPLIAQWKIQSPKPFHSNIKNIFWIDKNTGWVSGSYGGIYCTYDGGQTWEDKSSLINTNIYKLFFLNYNLGWAVGEDGIILNTKDGGKNWTLQANGIASWFVGIHFCDENNGWAVGHDKKVFKTNNGGKDWKEVFLPENFQGLDVYFIDKNVGFIGGSNYYGNYGKCSIYKTTNGGESWSALELDNSAVYPEIEQICFINSKLGFLIPTNGGVIYKTEDGGNNWEVITMPYQQSIYEGTKYCYFESDSVGWIGTYMNNNRIGILKTIDSGNNWEYVNIFDGFGYLIGFYFYYEAGILFSNSNKSTYVFKSNDGGENWDEIFSTGSYENIINTSFTDSLLGAAITSHTFSITKDGGQNWSQSLSYLYFDDKDNLQFSNNILWLTQGSYNPTLGDFTYISKSDDYGNNWQVKTKIMGISSIMSDESSIFFLNQKVGWFGGKQIFKKTTDGGDSWGSPSSDIKINTINKIYFNDENNGWMIGRGVNQSIDGGITWSSPQFAWINFLDLSFVDSLIGWIISEDILLKTKNGGNDWFNQYPPLIDEKMIRVVFENLNVGWILTDKSLFYTTDGGKEWEKITIPFKRSFSVLNVISHNKVIISGTSGFILEYTYDKLTDSSSNNDPVFSNYILQNYPNPFNSATKIKYSISHGGNIQISVYDILGQKVETLVNEYKQAGLYETEFNGNNLSSGIYFYRIISGNFSVTKKIILLR